MLRLYGYPKPIFTHDEFWKLDAQQRDHLEQEVRRIPKEWAREPATELITNYEAQQPPLYYALLALPLRLTANLTLPSRVLVLRLLSVIVASFLVPLGYFVARKILGNEMSTLGVVAVATVMPELMINISRVANESLSIVLYTLLVYLTLKVVDGPEHFGHLPIVGVVLGLGLLTKAYFLTALPALFVILVWCCWRWPSHWKRLILQSALGIGTAVAIGGVWYWRAHRMMGSWSGLYSDAAIGGMSKWGLLRQVFHVNWISALISVLLSHTWYGAWSFLRVSNLVYTVFGAVMLLAAAGLLRLSVKLWTSSSGEEESLGNYLLVLICFYGFFWLGLAYQTLTLFVSEGVSASTGWYMYCLVVPELILVYCGLHTTFPSSLRPAILPGLVAAFALLDVYTVHFLLIPYYSGIISHSTIYSGVFSHSTLNWVPPARIQQLVHSGPFTIAQRLLINKSPILTTRVLLMLWLTYIAATIWLTVSSWMLAKWTNSYDRG
jgi:4-amino-4-deoxy-L-arabinose transferase-like glycosyltransferase